MAVRKATPPMAAIEVSSETLTRTVTEKVYTISGLTAQQFDMIHAAVAHAADDPYCLDTYGNGNVPTDHDSWERLRDDLPSRFCL